MLHKKSAKFRTKFHVFRVKTKLNGVEGVAHFFGDRGHDREAKGGEQHEKDSFIGINSFQHSI